MFVAAFDAFVLPLYNRCITHTVSYRKLCLSVKPLYNKEGIRFVTTRFFIMMSIVMCAGFLALGAAGKNAYAQNCDAPYQEIMELKAPRFGIPMVWYAVYGEKGMEKFSDLHFLSAKQVVAAGEYTKDEEDNTYHPMLVGLDYRGRVKWETRRDSKEHTTIEGMIKVSGGFLVFGDLIDKKKGYGIYVDSYSDEGAFLKRHSFFEEGVDLDAVTIVPSHDSGHAILMAQSTNIQNRDMQFGVLYKVRYTLEAKASTSISKVNWKRSYRLGGSSVFHNIVKAPNQSYVATGSIGSADGRMVGWIAKLDDNGAISWQRSYPRGHKAAFLSAAIAPGGDILAVGEALPNDGGVLAAWVMRMDGIGQPIWQKYYRGDYFFSAQDSRAHDDGRFTVLIKADPVDVTKRSYVSLLTLSPRGYLMNYEPYVQGYNAHSFRLKEGPSGERVIVGHAQTSFPEDMSHEDIKPFTFDGWIVTATALEDYTDPCIPIVPER